MCGVLTIWTTLGFPLLMACVLSWSTLLRILVALQGNCPKQALGFVHFPGPSCSDSGSWVLHKGTNSVGSAFCALSRLSSSGNKVLGEHAVPGRGSILITSLVPAVKFPRCTVRAPSQVWHVSPLGSSSLAVTLLRDVNHSGSQENLVSNWEPAHILVEDAISGAEMPFAFRPWLPPACPSASSGVQKGLVHSRLAVLWYLLNPLFCEQARLHLRLELFVVKFSLSLSLSLFLSGYPTAWVAISR